MDKLLRCIKAGHLVYLTHPGYCRTCEWVKIIQDFRLQNVIINEPDPEHTT